MIYISTVTWSVGVKTLQLSSVSPWLPLNINTSNLVHKKFSLGKHLKLFAPHKTIASVFLKSIVNVCLQCEGRTLKNLKFSHEVNEVIWETWKKKLFKYSSFQHYSVQKKKTDKPVYNPRTLCVIGVLAMNLFSYNVGQLLNMELYVTHCEKLVLWTFFFWWLLSNLKCIL